MAKSKKKNNGNEDQRVEAIKALTQELEKIKLEEVSLIQRYNELSNDCANATNSITSVASLEKENEMLKAQVEKLTSEHVALQGTHLEVEKSYEMLVDSHVSLQVAHEVVIISITHDQPLTHTCTCSQVQIMLSCDKPCCSQATNSWVEHVVAESCDDLVVEENDELKREVEELKIEMIKLNRKDQV